MKINSRVEDYILEEEIGYETDATPDFDEVEETKFVPEIEIEDVCPFDVSHESIKKIRGVTMQSVPVIEALKRAHKARNDDYIKNGNDKTIEEFYSSHDLVDYVSEEDKKKSKWVPVGDYVSDPSVNALYRYVFTAAAINFRYRIRNGFATGSEYDAYIGKGKGAYGILVEAPFEEHNYDCQVVIQNGLTTLMSEFENIAETAFNNAVYANDGIPASIVISQRELEGAEHARVADWERKGRKVPYPEFAKSHSIERYKSENVRSITKMEFNDILNCKIEVEYPLYKFVQCKFVRMDKSEISGKFTKAVLAACGYNMVTFEKLIVPVYFEMDYTKGPVGPFKYKSKNVFTKVMRSCNTWNNLEYKKAKRENSSIESISNTVSDANQIESIMNIEKDFVPFIKEDVKSAIRKICAPQRFKIYMSILDMIYSQEIQLVRSNFRFESENRIHEYGMKSIEKRIKSGTGYWPKVSVNEIAKDIKCGKGMKTVFEYKIEYQESAKSAKITIDLAEAESMLYKHILESMRNRGIECVSKREKRK